LAVFVTLEASQQSYSAILRRFQRDKLFGIVWLKIECLYYGVVQY